ncbi:MAG: hypothetical protein HQL86_07835, partial [Magnetococcales bacterium]|nr:hypothetical protein [Magnetococcales bacterium]
MVYCCSRKARIALALCILGAILTFAIPVWYLVPDRIIAHIRSRNVAVVGGLGIIAAWTTWAFFGSRHAWERRIRLRWAIRGLLQEGEGLLLWFRNLHRNWAAALVLSPFVVLVFVAQVVYLPREALMAGDSATYLLFSNYRPIGYPLFLRFALVLLDDPWVVIILQSILGLAAILLFAEGLQRVFRNYVLAILVGLLLTFSWATFSL